MKAYIGMNQVGFIQITKDLIRNNSKELLKIYRELIILDVKDMGNGILTYKCLCKEFKNIQEGEKIPFYNVKYDNGKIIIIERK
ncbi:hypothetical protein [Clostridium haemolyticum]|uniref:Uncharacterized protein n=1 Tax=Clostridium haemolyticum NCTC 9693 TaxID=1443114 RepID=A0ABR4TGW5_CLOHA|nr:hypothetical protein [Clostridium haemolyticum]KEI18269.1 hypothetical protein Z960_03915 [Clostridium haemolyticum NCTC 9693]KGN04194.1 hypothetical protein Z961_04395 [Clostridium haemolyticum NCTC 8350]